VVPKELRERLRLKPGTTLDWQAEGDSLRVVKLEPPSRGGSGLDWIRRLGRVPAAPRDGREVEQP
jgi:bifunctional DNA-binding transcriptional regulator/antitoxin component of YhaV-PrlF toxin-antitoxin module